MKLLILFFISWSSFVFSQEKVNVGFLETQRTAGAPFSLPISVDTKGNISLFSDPNGSRLSFKPNLQGGLSFATIQYSRPVALNRFNFYPVQNELGWVEIKRLRLEAGAGLSSIMGKAFAVGLTPYKGSLQTIVRYTNSKQKKIIGS